MNSDVLNTIVRILNECLYYGVEAINGDLFKINELLKHKQFFNQLVTLLKEACGEDYKSYLKKQIVN